MKKKIFSLFTSALLMLSVLVVVKSSGDIKTSYESEYKEIYIGEWLNVKTLLSCDTKKLADIIAKEYVKSYDRGEYARIFFNNAYNKKGDFICRFVKGYIMLLETHDIYKIKTPRGPFYMLVFEFIDDAEERFYGISLFPIIENPNIDPTNKKSVLERTL